MIASILLLLPRTVVVGAILSIGTISGALFAHLTMLGFMLPAVGDNGELFALAVVVFLGSLVVLFLHRAEIPIVGRLFISELDTESPIILSRS